MSKTDETTRSRSTTTKSIEETHIDLGSDLLRVTGLTESKVGTEEIERESVTELLENAQILFSENFFEDSKNALRKVLIKDPGSVRAIQLLDQIQQVELRQLLGDQELRRGYGLSKKLEGAEEAPEDLIARLDEDFDLGLSSELTWTESETKKVFQILKTELLQAQLQDWTDLGIGFLEMEQFDLAILIFTYCKTQFFPLSQEALLSITSLLAWSYLSKNQPLFALEVMHETIRDEKISTEAKIDLFYLLGRSYEALKKNKLAFHFYRQVSQIDRGYRDVETKLNKQL